MFLIVFMLNNYVLQIHDFLNWYHNTIKSIGIIKLKYEIVTEKYNKKRFICICVVDNV